MKETFVTQPIFDPHLPFSIDLAGISYCDGSYKINRKKSDVLCIEYIISGCGTIKTRGKTFYAQQGDSFLLIPGEDHLYYSDKDEPWEKIWINATGSLIDSLIDSYELRDVTVFHCNSMPYIKKIHEMLSSQNYSIKEIADKTALYFHELVQYLSMNKPENKDRISSEALSVKNYIDKNIDININIETLSRLIYKSPAQTIRIFKKHYGTTPYNYYMERRLKKAILMLESTNYSVKEIAFKLGFGDEHYFSGVFRKKTGKKPSDYRLKH